jgi:hypothetical protein
MQESVTLVYNTGHAIAAIEASLLGGRPTQSRS